MSIVVARNNFTPLFVQCRAITLLAVSHASYPAEHAVADGASGVCVME